MQDPHKKYKKNQTKIESSSHTNFSKTQGVPRKEIPPKAMKNFKKGPKTPFPQVSLSLLGLALSFYVFHNTDEIVYFLDSLRFEFSSAQAVDPGASSQTQKERGEKEKNSPLGKKMNPSKERSLGPQWKSRVESLTAKNMSIFKVLENQRAEMDEKNRYLARLEEDLQQQKIEIEKQLKELEVMRREITSALNDKIIADRTSVEKLVGVYSNMKPVQAAKVIDEIDEELAIQILSRMKKQNAAAILNFVEPEKAQKLSEKYVGFKKKTKAKESR